MYCGNCGTELPEGTAFCTKCGKSTSLNASKAAKTTSNGPVLAPSGVESLKCPSCGAPIAPKFGEMVITCTYCGSGVTLGNQGWTNLQKQTMLALKVSTVEQVNTIIKPLVNNGILHRHRFEDSKPEEMSLTYVPYWIVSVSARTSITVANQAAQLAQTATSAAVLGVILGGMGGGFGGGGRRGGGRGGRRAFENQVQTCNPVASILGLKRIRIMAFGMGMGRGGGNRNAQQMDENYNFPVIALKALTDYQPHDYQFNLVGRELFDIAKLPKDVKILNGDISEEGAKTQAKTLVDQLQSQKAHAKYQAIQSMHTDCDVGDVELLHVPVWFAKFDNKGKKIVLVIDANSGKVINNTGL
ncbi:MAG TPA: zinc ribbon domain-containing protein [Candidatus Acidoferrales bacterium]|nr:zinc ribbon domain-containing protein [Candidatus Acidoferrales bacterium]